MMKRMSLSETIFLFFLALIIFGPKKLPEIARQVGKYMNEFRRASNEFKAQIEQEISNLEVEQRQTILPPSPPPEGVASRTLNVAPGEGEVIAAETATTGVPATLPATQATEDDEPLFANGAASHATTDPSHGAAEAASSDAVTSPTSQESHV
jgi:sec-independent protein translocase protein TatB